MGDLISNPNCFSDQFDFEDYEGTRDWMEASGSRFRRPNLNGKEISKWK
jgi:hypothetical protein